MLYLPMLQYLDTRTGHPMKVKSKISEKLGRCGRQNMLRPYLKIWDWNWIFGRAVKAISSLGVRSPWFSEWAFLESSFLRKIIHRAFYSESSLWEESQASCFSLCVCFFGKRVKKIFAPGRKWAIYSWVNFIFCQTSSAKCIFGKQECHWAFHLVPTTTEMFQCSAFVIKLSFTAEET